MSKRNILVSLALASALFAAPALADGKPVKPVRGPTPLKAQPYCESGKGYFDDHGRFVCPVVTRTVTRTVTPPTVTRVVAPPPAAVYDFSGFNGGVGSSIGSGYYGGGGGFIFEDRTRFSGVLQSSASAFTFNKKVKRVTRRPPPRPPGGGCGCN
ncbi:MAG: hypothetical protein R3C13_04715 [Hyphomonas sp.]|uniref:hypothetical protein n=1 Tax=Hyphomonas sp. TaxID=87 RepID=UPI003526E593